jgi:hypothetical protein
LNRHQTFTVARKQNYKVAADISLEEGYYYITKAYFPNGGNVTFENIHGTSNFSLEFKKKIRIRDDDNKWWDIELTNEIVRE